jgi:hypothetical protein
VLEQQDHHHPAACISRPLKFHWVFLNLKKIVARPFQHHKFSQQTSFSGILTHRFALQFPLKIAHPHSGALADQ